MKPVVKLLINRHNNKYSYTGASDDNLLKNIELFDKLSLRFSNRVLFIKDVIGSNEICCWSFYGHGKRIAEVCLKSVQNIKPLLLLLTLNTCRWEIQSYLIRSKLNMGVIFGLTFHLSYLHTYPIIFFELPPCVNKVIFVTEFVILWKSLLSMKYISGFAHEGISKK